MLNLGSTIGETIGNLPGVTNSGFTAGASRPIIRGQDAYRTEVLESGLSTQDVSRLSPDHALPINPLAAQAIEVVRGPGVLRYGGGASAGVVNVITNRIPAEPIDEAIRGDTLGVYQHNGNGGDFSGLLEGGVSSLAWHLDGLYRRADDYVNGVGTEQNGTDTEAWALSIGAAYLFEKGRLGFAYSRYDNEYGIPEDEPVDIDMRTNRYRFEGDWEDPLKGLREITVRGVYSNYTHDEVAGGVVGQSFDNDEFDGRLELIHEPVFGFFGALGLHGRYQELVARGEAEEFLAPSDTAAIAGYLFEEWPLAEFVDLELGVRVEGTWVEGTPITGDRRRRSFVPISGSAALIAHPADPFTIGLTGSASQRAPSQVELFARGPHEATGTFEIGDPDFDEETSYTGELRVAGDFDPLRFEASGFATYYNGYLFGQLAGIRVDGMGTIDPAGDFDLLLYRDRNAAFYGGEFTIRADLVEFLGGVLGTEWQIDYVRARFTDGGGNTNVPRIPPMRWGGSLSYEHDRFSGRFGFLRHEAQWDPSANEFATSAYTMLDLSARYWLPFFEDRTPLALGFTARNLLDEKARNAASITKDSVLLPGRSFRVSLQWGF
ncbi:MAG: TonB-dependent receptor [Deltaproteobacteria bacterium]|nr:TonB-dependent receptor [Deltaproteobacteria bacterium]